MENERRENRIRARQQNQDERPWRAGEKAMVNSVRKSKNSNDGRSPRGVIDSKPSPNMKCNKFGITSKTEGERAGAT